MKHLRIVLYVVIGVVSLSCQADTSTNKEEKIGFAVLPPFNAPLELINPTTQEYWDGLPVNKWPKKWKMFNAILGKQVKAVMANKDFIKIVIGRFESESGNEVYDHILPHFQFVLKDHEYQRLSSQEDRERTGFEMTKNTNVLTKGGQNTFYYQHEDHYLKLAYLRLDREIHVLVSDVTSDVRPEDIAQLKKEAGQLLHALIDLTIQNNKFELGNTSSLGTKKILVEDITSVVDKYTSEKSSWKLADNLLKLSANKYGENIVFYKIEEQKLLKLNTDKYFDTKKVFFENGEENGVYYVFDVFKRKLIEQQPYAFKVESVEPTPKELKESLLKQKELKTKIMNEKREQHLRKLMSK